MWGFPGGSSGKEPACQCSRQKGLRFNPWVGKIPRRRVWPPTPVFLPGEFRGQTSLAGYGPWDCQEMDMTEQLTLTNRFCVGFKVNQELVQTVLVCLFKTNLFPWYTHLLSDQTRLCGRQKRGRRSVCPLDSCLCHLCTTSTLYTSSPQSFRHHGLVSWKTIFHGPWRGDDFRMIQMHYFYCACCYYSTSSTSDHQALGLGGWRPQV